MIVYLLQIIGGLLTLAGKLFDYLHAKQMVDLAKTAQQLDNLKAQVDAAKKAVEIRDRARRAAELDPAGVMSDDEFVRPDE